MTATTPDTSVVVAGLSSWHPDHESARQILMQATIGIAHVIVESYSVLTRLPGGQRIPADVAWQALDSVFEEPPMVLASTAFGPLLSRLAAAGIAGGATYDALVAETARTHGFELVSFDRRATRTYGTVGVDYVLVEPSPPS